MRWYSDLQLSVQVVRQDLNAPNVPLKRSRLEMLQRLEEVTVLPVSDMDIGLIDLVLMGVSLSAKEAILETIVQD